MLKKIKCFWEYRRLNPFFDREFYLNSYPDVAASGMDPLSHYMAYGWKEQREPFDGFDAELYLKTYPELLQMDMNPLLHFVKLGRFRNRNQILPPHEAPEEGGPGFWRRVIDSDFDRQYYLNAYADVREAGMDPLDHYMEFGGSEGRNPTRYFQGLYYLKTNPDVAANGMNPFAHYILYGREEGRRTSSPILDLLELEPVADPWKPTAKLQHSCDISVVIPTYNRAVRLPSLLEAWKAAHKQTRYSYELIFSDDGSEDDTVAVLERHASDDLPIVILRNGHGGASSARNAAVAAARGAKVLFMGDDIYPDVDIINFHVEKLGELPVTAAVLGECGWHPDLSVNHLMRHITEIGCEQFSFLHLPRNGYTDFRHFYTCNISIDREFLISEATLFDERFYKYGFEDVELGYRLGRKGMQVFYFPAAYGHHHHSYADVAKFCFRQRCAGEMAVVFEKIHPELSHLMPLQRWQDEARARLGKGETSLFDFTDALTKLCQQIENRLPELDETLRMHLSRAYAKLFQFCFEMGYVQTRLPAYSPAIANAYLAQDFITPEVKQGLDAIQACLKLDDYAAFDQAWHEGPQPAPAPAAVTGSPQRHRLVIEAHDLAHLDVLRSAYGDFDGQLTFALKSDIPPEGLAYAPEPDTHIGRSNIAQLLLFNRANPQVDMVVLSHGHYDLPIVGVCQGHAATVLKRRGPARLGKVIRIYEGADCEGVPFDRAMGNNFRLNDFYGNFAHEAHSN